MSFIREDLRRSFQITILQEQQPVRYRHMLHSVCGDAGLTCSSPFSSLPAILSRVPLQKTHLSIDIPPLSLSPQQWEVASPALCSGLTALMGKEAHSPFQTHSGIAPFSAKLSKQQWVRKEYLSPLHLLSLLQAGQEHRGSLWTWLCRAQGHTQELLI